MPKFLLLIPAVFAVRQSGKTSSLAEDTPMDNRLPFPQGLDFAKLYCHDTPPSFGSIFTDGQPITTSSTGSPNTSLTACSVDADCSSNLPFCVTGFCRECRSVSDCTDSGSKFCSFETSFTCSTCQADSDCGDSTKICRAVAGIDSNRKTCVTCTSETLPPVSAIMSSSSNCFNWKCPENEMIGLDGECIQCPTCRDGQFLIPGEFFSFSKPPYFFPTCSSSRNAKCVDCPTNPCASVLSPSFGYSGDPDVGYLPPAYPCNAFKCNSGWYLDTAINQCRLCQLQSCQPGQFLNGCGGSSPGTCITCPPQLVPSGTLFTDPKSISGPINNPKDVCRPDCPSGFFLTRTSPSVPWQCANCNPAVCPPGTFLRGCGPGENPGECLPCASNPPAGWFWTPNDYNCGISQCTTCEAGSALVGCGGVNAGTCSPCLTPLPANAVSWISEFDQIIMATDSCSFTCRDGFFRSVDECLECTNCPIGDFVEGCSRRSPGRCVPCSPIGPSEYFVSPSNSTCQSEKCPETHTLCPPGQFLSGCGGVAKGTCEPCGFALPSGAEDWIQSSSIKCDFACKSDFFPTLNGTQKICNSCTEQVNNCPIGSRLVGCSKDSPGSCQACPALPDNNSYYGSNCSVGTCSQSSCGPGQILVGCGGTSPGTCTKCGEVDQLPPHASGWAITDNTCVPICLAGFYLNKDKSACMQCSLSFCRPGYVLTECGASNPGRCTPCDPTKSGLCFTGPGTKLGATNSCVTEPCSQQI